MSSKDTTSNMRPLAADSEDSAAKKLCGRIEKLERLKAEKNTQYISQAAKMQRTFDSWLLLKEDFTHKTALLWQSLGEFFEGAESAFDAKTNERVFLNDENHALSRENTKLVETNQNLVAQFSKLEAENKEMKATMERAVALLSK